MNINGHEIEKHGQWYDVDGYEEWSTPTSLEIIEAFVRRIEAKAARARAIVEYKRREAAEKDEQDAADELDRRAALAQQAWGKAYGGNVRPWSNYSSDEREWWRATVRALDADTAARGV